MTEIVVMRLLRLLMLAPLLCATSALGQEGHGGPVRALAMAADGRSLASGGLDQSAIVWALPAGTITAVLRFHQAAVNAVAPLPDGAFATGGADGRIAIWRRGGLTPERVLEGHTGPIAALTTDGARVASAAWDETARIWEPDGAVRVLTGHEGNVNAVALLHGTPVTGGADLTLRFWYPDQPPRILRLPAPQNALATAGSLLASAGADGALRFFTSSGEPAGEMEIDTTPLTALAATTDGSRLVVASVGGVVFIVDPFARRIVTVLHGAVSPVLSVALTPDGAQAFAGGRALQRWDARTGEMVGFLGPAPLQQPAANDRGARVFRACAVCHDVTAAHVNRAGPTLHSLFGRHVASIADYAYSDALRRIDQVWTPESVAHLFEIGPSSFAPGTRMPEQVIADPGDRAALVEYLQQVTR
jgi:cytochrome c